MSIQHGERRQVPLEIRVPEEQETLYNETFEDVGLYKRRRLALRHSRHPGLGPFGPAIDDDRPSSSCLYEAELTPAGLNLVDGRNAAFGYVVDGFDVLEELTTEDRIRSIKVIEGADGLRPHA